MDRVIIEKLVVETTIGVFEWERRIRQRLEFDLELATDAARAAAGDRLEDALDYKAVAKRVSALLEDSAFGLVESAAEAVAAMLAEEFGVRWMRVTVRKPAIDTRAAAVGIIIERGSI